MKYPYIVVKNGVWYPSGADVPDDIISFGKKEENIYKKTDINKMATSELRRLAKKSGVDNANDFTGLELKKILIELFDL